MNIAVLSGGNSSEYVISVKSAEEVKAWGDNFGRAVGMSSQATANFLASAQDLFVPLGFARDEAAELSKTVTRLAADLSVNNPGKTTEEAFNAKTLQGFRIVSAVPQIFRDKGYAKTEISKQAQIFKCVVRA